MAKAQISHNESLVEENDSLAEMRHDRNTTRALCIASLVLPRCGVAAAFGPPVRLMPCGASATQLWNVTSASSVILASSGLCLTALGSADSATVYTDACTSATATNQSWTFYGNGTIAPVLTPSMLLDVSGYGIYRGTAGAQVWLFHAQNNPNQLWSLSPMSGLYHVVNVGSGLCLDGGNVPRPCDPGMPGEFMDFCNTALPISARVSALVLGLSSAEAVPLFHSSSAGVPRLGIAPAQWWSEALHGVASSPGVAYSPSVPGSTSFPQVCTSAQAWNTSLWHAISSTISTEARAMNNANLAGQTFWTPNINIFRDPRWGRGQETPGEDPFLTAQYVVQFVTGMQVGEDARYLKTSSCCKHYAAYSLEAYAGVERYAFNAVVTPQDEADTYLVAFGVCVREAAVSSLMCRCVAVVTWHPPLASPTGALYSVSIIPHPSTS